MLHQYFSLKDKFVRFQKAVKSLNEEVEFKVGLINFELSAQLKYSDTRKRCDAMTLKNIVPL